MTKNTVSLRFMRLVSTVAAFFVALGAMVLHVGKARAFEKNGKGGHGRDRRQQLTPGWQGIVKGMGEMGMMGTRREGATLLGGRTFQPMVQFFVPAQALRPNQMETMMLQLAADGGQTMGKAIGAGRNAPAKNGMGGASA